MNKKKIIQMKWKLKLQSLLLTYIVFVVFLSVKIIKKFQNKIIILTQTPPNSSLK